MNDTSDNRIDATELHGVSPAAEPEPGCRHAMFEPLWRINRGSPDICVAILDGPVDVAHPCFGGADLMAVDAPTTSPDASAGPATRHGTHVASLIFGQPNSVVRGVAPGCRGVLIPIYEDGPDGTVTVCSQLDLARAITKAVQYGADVINISGGQFRQQDDVDPYLAKALRYCAEESVLVVAAAGNDGCECVHVPAAVDTVLPVGASDAEGVPLDSSNWGTAYRERGIVAPGQAIVGAKAGGDTVAMTGTSFATPLVTGTVALLLGLQKKRDGKTDPAAVVAAIRGGVVPCDETVTDDCRRSLLGRLDPAAALIRLQSTSANANEDESNSNPETGGVVDDIDMNAATTLEGELDMSEQQASGEVVPAGVTEAVMPSVDEATMTEEGTATTSPSAPSVESVDVAGAGVSPSGGCGCGTKKQGPTLAYVLGEIGHDFGTESRADSFIQAGLANPFSPQDLLAFLDDNPAHATGVTWVLMQETTPIYAIQPTGPFDTTIFEMLRDFYRSHFQQGTERVSIPGWVSGTTRLLNGQVVPVVYPDLRGMFNWSTPALVEAVAGPRPKAKSERVEHDEKSLEITNFLERIYYDIRNLGVTPQERAINFAATNAFQLEFVYRDALLKNLKLDGIGVEKSPVCRPGADCWDVRLTFFNPIRRQDEARLVYRFTIDVSDVVPVTVGPVRHWHTY